MGYIDATNPHVLDKPGQRPESEYYADCIRDGSPDKKIVIYVVLISQSLPRLSY